MPTAYLSIGSNIEREKNIPAGLAALAHCFGALKISSIYESAPVGFVGAPFYNLVAGFESDEDAHVLAEKLRQIEWQHGRPKEAQKFSARTLDLDLLLYGDWIINDGRLQIPRAEIEYYAFVLEPLAEIAPQLTHPMSGKSYARLWQEFDKTDVRQTKVMPAGFSEPTKF